MKIYETTFTNLKFSQPSPSSIGNLEESIQVHDSQTFNKAIKMVRVLKSILSPLLAPKPEIVIVLPQTKNQAFNFLSLCREPF